jgi:anti-sigma B factor antagonist
VTALSISLSSTGPRAVLLVGGELDLATAPELEAALSSLLADHPALDVDLRDVTFMSCAGINVLIAARAHAATAGVGFAVVRTSAAAVRIIRLARVEWLLDPSPATSNVMTTVRASRKVPQPGLTPTPGTTKAPCSHRRSGGLVSGVSNGT